MREGNPDYDAYINGENGIIHRWLAAGASGWRLDVADELPDCFLDSLNRAVKGFDADAVVLGEVWEDASNTVSYTHLDVYKRQRKHHARRAERLQKRRAARRVQAHLRRGVQRHFGARFMQPVSYTHLDVYKRQQSA